MACRFTATEIWDEDWFVELGIEYQHFWNYIKDHCNHAGIWKPNKSGFEMRVKTKVNLDSFFTKVNGDKERILRLRDGDWFLTGFIKFQWFNKKESFDLALTNRLHLSIYKELKKFNVPLKNVRGLREVLETSKDKVKETGDLKEEGAGEENFYPPVIEMKDIWQLQKPDYPFSKGTEDLSALFEIGDFVAKQQKTPWLPENGEQRLFLMEQWKVLAEWISADDFYKNFSLAQIAKTSNLQTIWQKRKDAPHNKATGSNNKPGTSAARIKTAREW